MAIIIGRDAATSNLKISIGKQNILAEVSNNVPKTVSREHCSIELQEDGKYLVKNLKVENSTYVNGLPIEKKVVTENDRLELGPDRYAVSWEMIKKTIPTSEKTVNIRPLKKIWNEYDDFIVQLQIAERKFNNMRAMTGSITMIAMIASFVIGPGNPITISLYVLTAISSIIFGILAHKKASTPLKLKEIEKKFYKDYSCPGCGRFLGKSPYDILIQSPQCPYCRAKFKS